MCRRQVINQRTAPLTSDAGRCLPIIMHEKPRLHITLSDGRNCMKTVFCLVVFHNNVPEPRVFFSHSASGLRRGSRLFFRASLCSTVSYRGPAALYVTQRRPASAQRHLLRRRGNYFQCVDSSNKLQSSKNTQREKQQAAVWAVWLQFILFPFMNPCCSSSDVLRFEVSSEQKG